MKPILKKGDIFCTANKQGLARILINFFQRNYNRDHKSLYTHAGVVIDESGITFEALPNGYHRQNIFEAYKDKSIIIFRSKYMTNLKFSKGFNSIRDLEGKWYPWHRIPLYIFPPLSRINFANRPVCSESVRKFLFNADIPTDAELVEKFVSHAGRKAIYGVDPDDLVDMCREDKNYEIIFEGVLT